MFYVFKTISLFFLIICLSLYFVEAATVLKVKGRKILIDMDGETFNKGDLFYIISDEGKKRGLAKIVKIKGTKAIAKISKKSKAHSGWTLINKKDFQKKSAAISDKTSRWGIFVGLGMDNMSVLIKDTKEEDGTNKTVNMSGNGFNIKGLFDYPLFNRIWLRGLIGLQQFATSSSTDTFCGVTKDQICNNNINYFSLDLWARYILKRGTFQPWIGGAFNLLHPLSHTSTTLDETSITTTNTWTLGGGFDWTLGKMIIPIQVGYSIYPSSKDVKATSIVINSGIIFPF